VRSARGGSCLANGEEHDLRGIVQPELLHEILAVSFNRIRAQAENRRAGENSLVDDLLRGANRVV